MSRPLPTAELETRSFADHATDLERLEQIVASWPEENRQGTVKAIRETLESMHQEALRRLIKAVKEDPAGLEALLGALSDPFVAGVLGYHGLIRAPQQEETLWDRVEAALEGVRPALASHAGDVELVAVEPPEVTIRLLGSCNGCAFSDTTVNLGIEEAVKQACPEIERVKVVQGQSGQGHKPAPGSSPFDRPWHDAAPAAEVKQGEVTVAELPQASLILTRSQQDELKAYPNACPHLGMPLGDGELADGVLTCRYHGFAFVLASGDCLTAPEVALPSYPARERDGRVEVQVPR